jgi:hypothetical protein
MAHEPVVVSFNQRSGSTAQSVNVNQPSQPRASLGELLHENEPNDAGNYRTVGLIVIENFRAANGLFLMARAASIKAIDAIPARTTATIDRITGVREGIAFTELHTLGPVVHFTITTTKPERRIALEYRLLTE